MKFWDSSAVFTLCVQEPQSALLKALMEEDGAIVAWWTTPVECYSALARLRREGIINRDGEDRARSVVDSLSVAWIEIEPNRQVRDGARRLLLLHTLRAADALQLAAALVWANGRPTGHGFVCLDQRLREAASREGFQVLPAQG